MPFCHFHFLSFNKEIENTNFSDICFPYISFSFSFHFRDVVRSPSSYNPELYQQRRERMMDLLPRCIYFGIIFFILHNHVFPTFERPPLPPSFPSLQPPSTPSPGAKKNFQHEGWPTPLTAPPFLWDLTLSSETGLQIGHFARRSCAHHENSTVHI